MIISVYVLYMLITNLKNLRTVSSLRRVPLQGLLGGDKHVRFIVVIILFYKKKKKYHRKQTSPTSIWIKIVHRIVLKSWAAYRPQGTFKT